MKVRTSMAMSASQAPCSQCPGVAVPKDALDDDELMEEDEFEVCKMQLH